MPPNSDLPQGFHYLGTGFWVGPPNNTIYIQKGARLTTTEVVHMYGRKCSDTRCLCKKGARNG